ncbi:PREDICTED: replication protein A 14 kDa subunit B-like [Amphimedon queenslandica]|uniref:Replication factor A protein 3 n=1 Tax=Amphimedon queenslandica TaxID=400682 RepID=A0A1X7VRM6_AMPQE|nr:PREDICTED: replication protein A 14 kDa subunit B-like [Amphimedon queenslandica]|eukprot:XP_011407052.1 PREDICTED: replication protein A 14 kDa subunit B-like [Amphimedon queenslandica]
MEASPRVNGSQLPKYIGQTVSIVGRTKGLGTTSGLRSVQLESSDKKNINIHFQQPLSEPLSLFVEVIGRVEPDLSISVSRTSNWGDNLDIDIYDEIVQLLPQYPALFSYNT